MKIIDVPQGSAEWLAAKAGKVSASRISDVLSRARDRKGEGATRRRYKAQIISEILTGESQEDSFLSGPMKDGLEREPLARASYELHTGEFVEQIGFVLHPTIERAGASPDALVGANGLAQFKCPTPATHIFYRLSGDVPTEYQEQMLWEMACAERDWCDFVSYSHAFPPPLHLFVVRFPRDQQRIIEITAEVIVFLREVDEIIERLNRKAA